MAKTPQELHQALADAFNSHDIERVLATYEHEGAIVAESGDVATGVEQLRQTLAGFLAIPGRLHVETLHAVTVGDLALARSRWKIQDAGEIKIQASGAELMRRQPNGSWRFVVDHPFGGEPLKSAKGG